MTRADDPILGPVRRCPRCGEWLPDDPDFYYAGVNGWQCRACWADYSAARRSRIRTRSTGGASIGRSL